MPFKGDQRAPRGRVPLLIVAFVLAMLSFGQPLAAYAAPTTSASDPAAAAKDKADDATTSDDAAPAKDNSGDAAAQDDKSPAADDTTDPSTSPSADDSSTPSKTPSDDPTTTKPDPSESSTEPTTDPSATEPSTTATPKGRAAVPDAQVAPEAVTPPTGNNALITVKVGGTRTSLTAVSSLAGVVLGLYASASDTTPVAGFGTCTSDADGDCSFTVPNAQSNGANRDKAYYVKQISAPSGNYTNPTLGTGTTVTSDSYVFPTCPQLRAGTICSSGATGNNGFMLATGTDNNEASGGIWQNSLTNPTFPAKCGINVAILHDLSNSVTAADLTNMKAASSTFVDALTGTPSQVSTFTFASTAPAAGSANTTLPLTSVSTAGGATTVKNKINAMTLPGGADGGTNWDRGIYQVAQSTSSFDVLMVITDGNPTYYGNVEGPGARTRFREVENGIFSSNAAKAESTRVIALGVGTGVSSAGSGLNLRSISGPTLNSDYYQTNNYAAAGAALRALALGNCTGSLTVVKQVVPAGAPANSTAGAVPQGGWTFTGTGSTGITFSGTNPQVTANGTGAANFPLTFTGGTTSGPATMNETQQSGYQLQTINGNNATCTRVDTGAAVTATNSGATGFTVPVSKDYPVSCVVYNKPPQPLASVILHKSWIVNGTTYADGAQPAGLIATGTLGGTVTPWEQEEGGYRAGDVVSIGESTNLSGLPLCTLNSARLTNQNGTTVNLLLPSSQTLAQGVNNYTITNAVTCGTQLKLTKSVEGGTAAPADWTLTGIAPTGALTGPTGTTGVSGTVTPNVTYTLSENNPHPEYKQVVDPNAVLRPGSSGSWTCQEVRADGTTVIPGFADGLNGGVTVPFGKYIRCNAVNQTATVVLKKLVQNTHGGTAVPANWNLTATPTGTFPAGLPTQTVTGSTAGASFNVRPGVAYAITESPGPAGYSLDSTVCDTAPGDTRATTVTPGPLDTITCTFTNVDTPATLTLVKTVTNDNGGTAAATAWTLAAAGATPISGTTGSTAVTNAAVSAGTYTLSESGGPAGYAAGAWSCTGATLTGSSVVVTNGANVTCTINNNDIGAHLTLVKTVTNDSGGTAVATAWTLAAAGPTPISGATGSTAVTNAPVNAGTYTLSETGGPAGYTAGSWSCTAGTLTGSSLVLPLNTSATCTINNNDQPATLSLVKVVDNGTTGANHVPADWILTAAGPTPVTGVGNSPAVTSQTVNAGRYALTESGGPAGYTASGWSCTGGPLVGSTVTVPNGGNVTCTITNTAEQPLLTLVKVVDNGTTGGTAVPGNWTLTATSAGGTVSGPGNSADVTNQAVSVGAWTLSESGGPAGYTGGAWSCTGATLAGTTLTVVPGTDATCTITNTAQQAHLTLVKAVTNNNGGTAVPTAWTLAAAGPTTGITGATGGGSVTNVPVNPGTYTLSESGGPAGYLAGTWSCTAGTLSGANVTLQLGQNATCTINNDDQPATLTLVKTVTNDDGGTAVPTDWTLTAAGPTTITGASGSTSVTGAPVGAGTYALSESGGPNGYTAGTWSCTAGTLSGASLVLANGASATCTIDNDDQPATLTLVKTVTNDNGGTAVPTEWTLAAAGPTPISGATGSDPVTGATVDAGTYTLSETGPGGYDASAWSCTAGTLSGATLVLPNGVSATCTINNDDQAATLTLVKVVDNDTTGATFGPADWTLSATGPTSISGAGDSPDVTSQTISAGSYTLSESGPAGYDASDWDCDGGTLTDATLVIPNAADITCTITNTVVQPTLTLVKVVDNGDTGATFGPADWTLTAAGPSIVTGAGNSAEVTNQDVPVGDYSLSESGGPDGYTATSWACTDATDFSSDSVTIAPGDHAVCTITNSASPVSLTLIKVVDNGDTGATTSETAWTLTAAGPVTVSGTSGVSEPAAVGSYDLSEVGPGGYDASGWVCDGAASSTGRSVTLALDNHATCTITNTARQPHLTLVKEVVNDDGGTAVPTDWTLTAAGPTPISGAVGDPAVTNAAVEIGDYTLDENALLTGYTASDWDCDGATLDGSTVSIALGDDVTCTITNDDQPAHLTLVKSVLNGDTGATAAPADWTLNADGPTPVSGDGNSADVTDRTVDAGAYTLSETDGPDGYTAGDWSCGDGAQLVGNVVTVPNGGNVTCTIANTAQQPHLTLVKTVTNDNGGTAVATDWTLSADGPTTGVSGPVGDPGVSNVPVEIGGYALSEAGGPTGYASGDWNCVGGSLDDATVTVALGDDVTCTINNDDEQAHLTLVKQVDNGDSGATTPATDWTLGADGATAISGATGSDAVTGALVDAGTYDLSETGPDGYTASTWDCGDAVLAGTTLTVPNGGNITCTIVNTAIAPTLTLVKIVDNGTTGATHAADEWALTADGPTLFTVTTGTTTSAQVGTYDLSESGPDGYDMSDWVCTGASDSSAETVTLALDENATCTVTNTARQPHLTLVKTVTNDNGGTALPTDWTLSADGPTAGVTGPVGDPTVTGVAVAIGDYDLSEADGPTGYEAGAWSCDGGSLTGSTVSVALGDDVTCTINNDDVLGSWDLAKASTPISGSTVLPGDTITYTVTATKTGGVNPVDRVVNDDLSNVLNNATLVGDPVASTGTASITGTTLSWDIPSLGGTETVSYTVRINPDAYGVTVGNVVTGEGSDTCPPADPGDECQTTHVTPHYTLTKTSDPASGSTVLPGDSISYTLTVHNDSEAVLTGALVTDDLSDVLDNATLGTVGDGGSVTGTTLTWTVPTIQPGDSTTLTYAVTVNDGAYGQTIGNVATPGPGGECEEAADCTTTHETPGWTLSKNSDPASGSTVEPGDTITYTLRAVNTSQAVVTGAVATDDLSDVLDDATLGTVGSGGSVTGTTLTWDIPTLQPGGSTTLDYTVTVNGDAVNRTLHNVATPGAGGDCVVASADRRAARAVQAARLVAAAVEDPEICETTHYTSAWTLEKSSDPASGSKVQPGSTISYRLTATNVSDNATLSGAMATDDLSAVLDHGTLVSVPADATLSGTTLTWSIPDLAPGASTTLTYQVKLDSDAWNVTVTNVATPGQGGQCPTACTTNHNTPPKPHEPNLPNTGGPALTAVGVGIALLLGGGGLLLWTRRRKSESQG